MIASENDLVSEKVDAQTKETEPRDEETTKLVEKRGIRGQTSVPHRGT